MRQPIGVADIPALLYTNLIANIIIAVIGKLIKKSVIVNVIILFLLLCLILKFTFPKMAQTATIILPGLPQPPIIVKSAPIARLHDDWCLLFLSFRCGNLAGCEQCVFAKQDSSTMRCIGIQKSSIIATFSRISLCF